ncbi:3317_t:CDS:1, partial [Paraglomus brasilianum]
SSCEVDTDCPVGFVCSTTPSTQGQCIYGCHTSDDCQIDATDTQNQTCDKNLPRWSCTCGNDTVCDGDGICAGGHCVLPFNFGMKGIFSLCGVSSLESTFEDVCAWLLNQGYTQLGYEAAVIACDGATDGFGVFFCEALVSILFKIVGDAGGIGDSINDVCHNAWLDVCDSL